jgi:hypothetical protein
MAYRLSSDPFLGRKPSATYGRFKTVMTDRARKIGANAQTQRRLEAVLNEQQEGPTQEDQEALT